MITKISKHLLYVLELSLWSFFYSFWIIFFVTGIALSMRHNLFNIIILAVWSGSLHGAACKSINDLKIKV